MIKDMHELELHYSVQNGGDGSAYPKLVESSKLATWDQDHMYEGWGEDCSGSIILKSESPIICDKDVATKENYLIDKYITGYSVDQNEMDEYIEEFFPEGLPTFRVEVTNAYDYGDDYNYRWNHVYIGDKLIAKEVFRKTEESGEVFEKLLNSRPLRKEE